MATVMISPPFREDDSKKPVPDNVFSGSGDLGGCSRTQVPIARMAAALSFMSTVVNNAPLLGVGVTQFFGSDEQMFGAE
jgi:hypothetical protein